MDFELPSRMKRLPDNGNRHRKIVYGRIKHSIMNNNFTILQNKTRKDIGEVVFDRAGVKTSFEHRIYQNKLDALPAIPDVIEKGKIIDISNDFDESR